MFTAIIKDLIGRFGNIIIVALVAIVAAIALYFTVQSAFPSVFGPSKGEMREQIRTKDAVIDTVVQTAADESKKHQDHTAVQEQSKNDLVEHVEQQHQTGQKFDSIANKADRATPQKSAKNSSSKSPNPPSTDNNEAANGSVPDAETTAKEIQRAQQTATVMQDAVWEAYALATAPRPR